MIISTDISFLLRNEYTNNFAALCNQFFSSHLLIFVAAFLIICRHSYYYIDLILLLTLPQLNMRCLQLPSYTCDESTHFWVKLIHGYYEPMNNSIECRNPNSRERNVKICKIFSIAPPVAHIVFKKLSTLVVPTSEDLFRSL